MREPVNLIQIVPGLPPRVDGIGDYALQLAQRFAESSIATSFVVGDPEWKGREARGFPATAITRRSPEALVDSLTAAKALTGACKTSVLVHFSPYGYQLRGCPFWMATGLERWAHLHLGTLHIAFHELEGHSWRPWSSTFWVPSLQRSILRRVARVAESGYTNTELHRIRLKTMGADGIGLIPNFSTMGEPTDNPPFANRRREIVVFGRAAQRRWTYQRGGYALRSVCKQWGIERIIDIGEPIPGAQTDALGETPILHCGRLEAQEVNARMATSFASFLYYPIPFLAKSSVYAVSCAHGCIPLIFDDSAKESACPGLVPGEDFLVVSRNGVDEMGQSLESISLTVHRKYRYRSSDHAAMQLKSQMGLITSP